jgi:hypothetical protein
LIYYGQFRKSLPGDPLLSVSASPGQVRHDIHSSIREALVALETHAGRKRRRDYCGCDDHGHDDHGRRATPPTVSATFSPPRSVRHSCKRRKGTDREVRTFCRTRAYAGCRISEAQALTADRVYFTDGVIVFEGLKKRRADLSRAVPVPSATLDSLDLGYGTAKSLEKLVEPSGIEPLTSTMPLYWCRSKWRISPAFWSY